MSTMYQQYKRKRPNKDVHKGSLMKGVEMRILLGSKIPILFVTNVTTAAIFDRPCGAWQFFVFFKKRRRNCPQSRTSNYLNRKSRKTTKAHTSLLTINVLNYFADANNSHFFLNTSTISKGNCLYIVIISTTFFYNSLYMFVSKILMLGIKHDDLTI